MWIIFSLYDLPISGIIVCKALVISLKFIYRNKVYITLIRVKISLGGSLDEMLESLVYRLEGLKARDRWVEAGS